MPEIKVIPEGDGCWPDLTELRASVRLLEAMGPDNARPIELAILQSGMESGAASISIRLELPDGRVVLTETSVLSLIFAANIIAVYCPDEARRGAEMFMQALKQGGTAVNPFYPEDSTHYE